jgi:hypothetical protein
MDRAYPDTAVTPPNKRTGGDAIARAEFSARAQDRGLRMHPGCDDDASVRCHLGRVISAVAVLAASAAGCGALGVSPGVGSTGSGATSSAGTDELDGSGDTTGSTGPASSSTDDGGADPGTTTGDPSRTIVVRFAFVHGVLGEADSQRHAEDESADLEAYLLAQFDARANAYESAHPGLDVEVASARLNLYTDVDGALLVPGLDEVADDGGITTANRWREQLALDLELAYPGQSNLVVVGHSTGARAAMEVTAGVIDDAGPGSHAWPVADRVAGVVALHGMIDALGNPAYDFLGPISFLTGCKLAQADGWCEYASEISAVAASDWVAAHRRALGLIAWGDCSPSLWTGQNDKSLPLRAQGSPGLAGMTMTPAADGTVEPAHGVLYGNFCHSDVTASSSRQHDAAIAASMDHVLDWVFDAAPRVTNPTIEGQRIDVAPLPAATWSRPAERGDGCGTELDAGPPELVGACVHDGAEDHALDEHDVVEVVDQDGCTGVARWQHLHDGESGGARLWMKTYAEPEGGGLIATLVAE